MTPEHWGAHRVVTSLHYTPETKTTLCVGSTSIKKYCQQKSGHILQHNGHVIHTHTHTELIQQDNHDLFQV